MPRLIATGLTAGAVLWIVALSAAAASRKSTTSDLVYGLASRICHQRPERSFRLSGQQLPVCGRCAGLYVSGAVGALAAWLARRRHPGRSREILLIGAIPTAATLAVEWSGLSDLSNSIRAISALPLGGAAGWVFVRALRAEARAPLAL